MYTASLYGTKPYIPSAITPITSFSHGLSYSYISSFKSQHELIGFRMGSQRTCSLDKSFGSAQGTPTHIYTASLKATRPIYHQPNHLLLAWPLIQLPVKFEVNAWADRVPVFGRARFLVAWACTLAELKVLRHTFKQPRLRLQGPTSELTSPQSPAARMPRIASHTATYQAPSPSMS